MISVAHLVQKYIDERSNLSEAMARGIVSYSSLAREMKGDIEKELGKKVNTLSITMALRRYSEKIVEKHKNTKEIKASEIVMKTNLCDICAVKSPSLMGRLKSLHSIVDFEKGETFNIIHGSYEVVIVTNEAHEKSVLDVLSEEKVLHIERNLAALSLVYPKADEFLYTTGVMFQAIRALSWENINIFEVVSTNTELTFIINKEELMKGYKCLEKLL